MTEDDYVEETPEEREAGRQMAAKLEHLGMTLFKHIKGEATREEVETLLKEMKDAE